MIALIEDIITREPVAIHRRELTKAVTSAGPAKALGHIAGGAIKLARPLNGELAIGEGIETCLSGMQLGYGPAWSVISAGGVKNFPVLGYIDRLTIFVDHDEAGQNAAAEFRARWEISGKRVRYVTPKRRATTSTTRYGRRSAAMSEQPGLRIEESAATEKPDAMPLEVARMIVRALLNGVMQGALKYHQRRNEWLESGKPWPKSFEETVERRERLQRAYRSRVRDDATKHHDKLYLDILRDGCDWHLLQSRHTAMRVPTGVGKSHAAREAAAQSVGAATQGYVAQAKARGLPWRVLFLVPTHSLGKEARLRMPDGIKTALWQGREAVHPVTGEPLCLNPASRQNSQCGRCRC